jgi:hypothetical protein
MMMGKSVIDDGLLVTENHQKPGFVSVIGGSLTKPKEMKCQEAEIYNENHMRGKLGLEKTDQMPPKQSRVGKAPAVAVAPCQTSVVQHADRNTAPGITRKETGDGTSSPVGSTTGRMMLTI